MSGGTFPRCWSCGRVLDGAHLWGHYVASVEAHECWQCTRQLTGEDPRPPAVRESDAKRADAPAEPTRLASGSFTAAQAKRAHAGGRRLAEPTGKDGVRRWVNPFRREQRALEKAHGVTTGRQRKKLRRQLRRGRGGAS